MSASVFNGGARAGESVFQTVLRELYEEGGIRLSLARLMLCPSMLIGGRTQIFVLELTCEEIVDMCVALMQLVATLLPPPALAVAALPAAAPAHAPFIAGPAASAPPTPAAPDAVPSGPAVSGPGGAKLITASGGSKFVVPAMRSSHPASRAVSGGGGGGGGGGGSGGGGGRAQCAFYLQGRCQFGNRCHNAHN